MKIFQVLLKEKFVHPWEGSERVYILKIFKFTYAWTITRIILQTQKCELSKAQILFCKKIPKWNQKKKRNKVQYIVQTSPIDCPAVAPVFHTFNVKAVQKKKFPVQLKKQIKQVPVR